MTESAGERRRELANARWAILRDALLQKTSSSSQQHSIHRFGGYELLKARAPNEELGSIEPLLKKFEWDVSRQSFADNLDGLEIAVLALAACFPKGNCLQVEEKASESSPRDWFDLLRKRCDPSVCVWKVKEEKKDTLTTTTTTTTTTLLVQETSASTKYCVRIYDLGGSTKDRNSSHCLWTREPRETRLSLDDLVSHRKNKGVDNTGNICVWDSERTLAYLLYHHFDDFSAACGNLNVNGSKTVNVLELGTGMAGLAAVSLGLRMVMHQRQQLHKTEESTCQRKSVHVILTDGNSSGVKNNIVNQYLTRLHAELQDWHPYKSLHVTCELLLWNTDMIDTRYHGSRSDVILISDCTHFQNFHAALAITTIRCLEVGGTAVFCQPTRGHSLDNFYNLLVFASISVSEHGPLVSCAWWSHPVVEEEHLKALLRHKEVYDETLHRPKILLVTKEREMTEQDWCGFIAQQEVRS